MRCGGDDTFDGRKFFGHEPGNFLQAATADKYEQVVAAGHEIAGLNFFEATDAFGQSVESAAAFGSDAHFDDGADGSRIFIGEIQHRAPAEQNTILLELLQLPGHLVFSQMQHLSHLRRAQAAAFEQELN